MDSFIVDEKEWSITLDFKNCKETLLKPKEALTNYIYELVERYPPPYTLFASGGVDSQVMIHSFVNSGIPFKIKSIKFLNNLNIHDIKTLDEFAEINNLVIEYIDVNIIDFFENDLTDYVKRYQCSSPQMCAHMNWVDKYSEGTCFFSGTPPFLWGLEFTQDNLPFYYYSRDKNLVPFFLLQNDVVCSAFFNLQREVIESSFIHPEIDYMLPQGHGTYLKKCKIYELSGFNILPQEKKLSGFELVKEHYDKFTDRTNKFEKLKYYDRPSNRIFDIIFRYRMEDFVDKPRKFFSGQYPDIYKYTYAVY